MATRKQPTISDDLLDQLLAGPTRRQLCEGRLHDELKKAFAERTLNAGAAPLCAIAPL